MSATRATLGACLIVLAGCAQERTDEAAAEPVGESTVSTTFEAAPEPLEIGPIAYFDNHCARCHGGNGSLYARPYVAPDDELPRIVEEMCAGPAMAPLEGRPLEALVDYHIAIRDRAPFVALVGRDESGLIFETTPGLKLQARGGETTSIGVDLWRIEASGAVELVAEREDGLSQFHFPDWPAKGWSRGSVILATRYGPF